MKKFFALLSLSLFFLYSQSASAIFEERCSNDDISMLTTHTSYVVEVQLPNPAYYGEPPKYSPMHLLSRYLAKPEPYLASAYLLIADPFAHDDIYLFSDDQIDLNNLNWRYPGREQAQHSSSNLYKKYYALASRSFSERRFRILGKIPSGSKLLVKYHVYDGFLTDMSVIIKSGKFANLEANIASSDIMETAKSFLPFKKRITSSHFPAWLAKA